VGKDKGIHHRGHRGHGEGQRAVLATDTRRYARIRALRAKGYSPQRAQRSQRRARGGALRAKDTGLIHHEGHEDARRVYLFCEQVSGYCMRGQSPGFLVLCAQRPHLHLPFFVFLRVLRGGISFWDLDLRADLPQRTQRTRRRTFWPRIYTDTHGFGRFAIRARTRDEFTMKNRKTHEGFFWPCGQGQGHSPQRAQRTQRRAIMGAAR
jgi:hypothetical protein